MQSAVESDLHCALSLKDVGSWCVTGQVAGYPRRHSEIQCSQGKASGSPKRRPSFENMYKHSEIKNIRWYSLNAGYRPGEFPASAVVTELN